MRTIQFTTDNLIDEIKTLDKPVVNLVRVVFNSNNSKWVERLTTASLTLESICFDEDQKEIYRKSNVLPIASYITEHHRQPVLEINYTENFRVQFEVVHGRASFWKTSIVLKGIELQEHEIIKLSILDNIYIKSRIDDWKNRIDALYADVSGWLSDKPDYTCKVGHSTVMFEELMQTFEIPQQNIKSLDISFKDKIVLAFKPKGLWVIGANGRIDIISSKGSILLVDFAEHFQLPQWYIYTRDRKVKSPFNKETFYQVITIIGQ